MSDTAQEVWDRRILEHEAWLRSVVRSRIAAPDQAEDVLQNVLAQAFGFRERGQEVEALGPWLYRLAVRGVLQFRRTCGRRRRLDQNYKNQQVAVACDTTQPLDLLLGNERRDLVQSALARLDGRDIEILTLKYIHTWSYQQICDHLGLTHYKVTHRLRRAREHLKRELGHNGISDHDSDRPV